MLILFAVLLLMPVGVLGQSYQELWKAVEQAQQEDLPKTAMNKLHTIAAKAEREKAYGQLLKSTLLDARLQAEIAPDSLLPAVKRLEQREQRTKDLVLRAVYDAVLSTIYGDNSQLADNWETLRDDYRQRALSHPELLAAEGVAGYMPFVISGADSQVFGNDLLSVIGAELDAWDVVTAYYEKAGKRAAACMAWAQIIDTVERADSLIALYGDLPEAIELAICRYQLMTDDRFSVADKYAWLKQSLQRWGTTKRAQVLEYALMEMTNPQFRLEVPQRLAEVGKSQMIKLYDLRHLETLTMRVYQTTLTGDSDMNPNSDADFQKMGLTELKDLSRTLTFSGHPEYELFKDSVLLGGLPAGVYVIAFETQPQTVVSRMRLYVSSLRVLMLPQPGGNTRFVAVNTTTGQPVSGATLRMSFGFGRKADKKKFVEVPFDKNGELVYTMKERPSEYYAYTQNDRSLPTFNHYGSYSFSHYRYPVDHVQLFTDRSIYRPGQSVYVTAIAWKDLSATESSAVSDKALTFELRDANYKLVGEQKATTDRYGKCSAVFTLPVGRLNGRFTITTRNGSTSFRVEEYKRPTFQVDFADYEASYQAGDTLRVQGKAVTYAGVPVQGGQVKYTVKRRIAYWWMNYSRYWQWGTIDRVSQEEVLHEATAVTADDGTFTVEMPLVMPEGASQQPMFYHFVVEADVTDMAGETHSGTLSLPLGNKPTALTCDLPQQVRIDQRPQVTFKRYNAAGKEIAGTVRYRINGGRWQECPANTPQASLCSSFKSGEYRLEAVCETDTVSQTFIVFSLNDTKPVTKTHDWFYVSHEQFPSDGTPVTLQVGSSDPSLYIYYSIFADDQLIEKGVVKKNAQLLNRKLTYQKAYGNGLLLTYAWVKDDQCYKHRAFIRRPMPDKKLKMTWTTFRDRLTPGQQEQWRLTVKHSDGTPADASVMAVLYDKSLDAINPHQWSFRPVPYMFTPSVSWSWSTKDAGYGNGSKWYQRRYDFDLTFSHFDHSVYPAYFDGYGSGVRLLRTTSMSGVAMMPVTSEVKMMTTNSQDMVMAKGANAEAAADAVIQEEPQQADAGQHGETATPQSLRENLNETAFCYSAVEADKHGEVVLNFTLPESLTTWRFMGVSNTPQMSYGTLEGEVIAQKDVMVQPNIPRFIRLGDEAQLSARIFNTTDHAVSGQAKMELIDAESGQPVSEQMVPFTVEAGKTAVVNGQLSLQRLAHNGQSASHHHSLLICRVTAQGDGFSDGEQHYLPVLPNQEYVTKTVPFTQHEPGVKTIDLKKLFPQGTTQQKLTLEYTNHPAWLMVQSLPTVGQPAEHSAIDQAASYYSNLLARNLLKQNPQVKGVFEQWKREDSSLFTLHSSLQNTLLPPEGRSVASNHSSLQKNEELKDLLLAETPWVLSADRETEQKQRLADFFDENCIDNRLAMAAEKLQKLQNGDGSYSWFPGMPGSLYITVTVEEMLARLQAMTGNHASLFTLHSSFDKAFNYMGSEMVTLVNDMKKAEKKGVKPTFPSFTALRWLYICAIDGRQLSADVKSANDYLISLLKKDIKRQTIYEKALTAVVLAKNGDDQTAARYVKSLKEYTVYTDEMGRYYDTPRAAYSWYDYKIPTEVAAIEAIQLLTPDDRQTVDEMRRWLLQEKRTQAWTTPINSTNAIYAFLNGNSQLLTTTAQPTTFTLDGRTVSHEAPSAGIGYVKTAQDYHGEKSLTVSKTSEGTSWGAVYAQFFQQSSEVESSHSGITIKREMMSMVNGQWSMVNGQCKVGDRVKVRITIETSRDLDFVQVVDRRAACMEPVIQLSGYRNGAYISPKDHATHYFYYGLSKGRHVIETEYYMDRAGSYETGTCTAGCAYAPEYRATAAAIKLKVTNEEK